jgi:hypothetical protein
MKNRKLLVKPIIPIRIINELVIDLIDFTKESNNNMNWIM